MRDREPRRFASRDVVFRAALDSERPGIEVLDSQTERVIVSAWMRASGDDHRLWVRTWEEVDLWMLEEIAAYAQRDLGG